MDNSNRMSDAFDDTFVCMYVSIYTVYVRRKLFCNKFKVNTNLFAWISLLLLLFLNCNIACYKQVTYFLDISVLNHIPAYIRMYIYNRMYSCELGTFSINIHTFIHTFINSGKFHGIDCLLCEKIC